MMFTIVTLKYGTDEAVVITNMRTLDLADHVVTEIGEFQKLVFGDKQFMESGGHRGEPPRIPVEVPIWWHFDECSTHLDARTVAHQVANKYLPLVKRFAKVRVDAVHIGHSGMDINKDMRRSNITTEFIFKTRLKTAEVYNRMKEDRGFDLKYVLSDISETGISYDPDDYSPWSWSQ